MKGATQGFSLFTIWYDCLESDRFDELHTCLLKNCENTHIRKIFVCFELLSPLTRGGIEQKYKTYLAHSKVELLFLERESSRQISFLDLIKLANNNLDQDSRFIISNSDIYFDDSLSLAENLTFESYVLSLTRHNVFQSFKNMKGNNWERKYWTQDSWFLKAPFPEKEDFDINLGWIACDNVINYNFFRHGFDVYNPSDSIISWHYHKEAVTINLNQTGHIYKYDVPHYWVSITTVEDVGNEMLSELLLVDKLVIKDIRIEAMKFRDRQLQALGQLKKFDFEFFNKIFVINLESDIKRKEHIVKEFDRIGIRKYEFVKAIEPKDGEVKDFYLNDKVKTYPTCFRCQAEACTCDNNFIIPAQVANWCSFIKVWKEIDNNDYQISLICEDDVKFSVNVHAVLRALLSVKSFAAKGIDLSKPLLIRLGKSGGHLDDEIAEQISLSNLPEMSNPAYIINLSMARLLLKHASKIEHTSDVFVHSQMPQKNSEIQAFTVSPLIATELSYNVENAEFYSMIHPKGIDEWDLCRKKKHVKRVESGEAYIDYIQSYLKDAKT